MNWGESQHTFSNSSMRHSSQKPSKLTIERLNAECPPSILHPPLPEIEFMKLLSALLAILWTQQIPMKCIGFAWNNSINFSRFLSASTRRTNSDTFMHGSDVNDSAGGECNEDPSSAITQEIERLQQQLTYIEALEERNRAQIYSFIDEQHQWESMEEDERQLLQSKDDIKDKMEQMTSELVSLWMGGKSMEG